MKKSNDSKTKFSVRLMCLLLAITMVASTVLAVVFYMIESL